MSNLDWIILFSTIFLVVGYGIWKGKNAQHSLDGYLLANRELPWYHVLLSVMATQASAITFLSAPGQAYSDGMRFVQFYMGLPIAMIILSITFIPNYYQLKVYTAYQYLESRFDAKTRVLTSLFFLIPRALSTGVTIAAPSIILSIILGWNLTWTNSLTAFIVTSYVIMGGSKSISYTQLLQMAIVFTGMVFVAIYLMYQLPEKINLNNSLKLAGNLGKMNVIDWNFDWNNRYNIWSGIIGGFFLQLSYFGTDQSQVGRYLTGQSIDASRRGLLINGLVKIPMQFFILIVGILVFTFYQFNERPMFFNDNAEKYWTQNEYLEDLESQKKEIWNEKQILNQNLLTGKDNPDLLKKLRANHAQEMEIVNKAKIHLEQANPNLEIQDTNYIFLHYVIENLPIGIIGFLIAMILLASMGSMASAFGSLTSTTMVDIYQRYLKPGQSDQHYWWASRISTLIWGIFCLIVAEYATKMGSLIEVVNILGSWFYGTVLGVFLCAFYLKKTTGTQVFWAAVFAEIVVIFAWYEEWISFLWLNVLGCLLVIVLASILRLLGFGTK
ncbi:MAG: hypothetical protein RIR51_943 [Bacteroidota bacterium]|jgi:Na+/proline symporter